MFGNASPATAPNYALLSIPAYMVIAQLPHAYSVYLITSNNNWKWDNASPRSTSNKAHVEKSVPKDCYRKFERCRAAHDNMFENSQSPQPPHLLCLIDINSGFYDRRHTFWRNHKARCKLDEHDVRCLSCEPPIVYRKLCSNEKPNIESAEDGVVRARHSSNHVNVLEGWYDTCKGGKAALR